jgi:hypothetical protein
VQRENADPSVPCALDQIVRIRRTEYESAVMTKRIAEASPRFKARMAGALNLLSALRAAFTELFVRGRLNIAGGFIAIAGMVSVTLLVYDLFKSVNKGLSLLAASFNFVALTFDCRQSAIERVLKKSAKRPSEEDRM